MYGVLGAAAMLCLLVACGQKGPLYLPESKNTTPEEQMESEKTDQVKEVVNTEDQGAL
ncbi:MAG: lipoprotein [Pseudomonadota bacterium]